MVNRGRHGDRAKGVGTPIGSGDDQLHHTEVEIRQPVCHRVVDRRPVVGQRHRHRLVQRDKRSQPVVRGLDVLDGPESQIADIFGTFEVLDREQGVEQLANTQRRMEIPERNMLVVEHFGLRADKVVDNVVHGVALGPAHPGGHGVQQHPDDPVDAVHIFATTRRGGTEHHIGPPHDAAQQNTPCRGHHGTLADRSRSGVHRQCLPVIGSQRTTAPTEATARTARQVVGDQCRISDVGEVVLPRFHLALWRSPLRPPPQEVAELRCAGVEQIAAIRSHDVVPDQRHRPTVGDQMVHRLDEPVPTLPDGDQGVAHQRRPSEIERAAAFLRGNPVHELRCLQVRFINKTQRPELRRGRRSHGRDDPARTCGAKARRQCRMSADHRVRGLGEPVDIEWPGQLDDLLNHVGVVVIHRDRMEIDAGLDGCQWQHLTQTINLGTYLVRLVVLEFDKRRVGCRGCRRRTRRCECRGQMFGRAVRDDVL